LVRKIVLKDNQLDLNQFYPELNGKLGDVLLTPTKIYIKPVLDILNQIDVHAICHITGGGFDENIPRVLTENQGIEVDEKSWEKPPIFDFLEKYGKVDHREMFNIYNMGIGMVLVIKEEDQEQVIQMLHKHNEKGFVIGKVTDQPGVNILLNE
jgi:phosphoribosylformylglycinamidine cyclo-ligase